MQEHPFTGTLSRKINFLLLFLTGFTIEAAFLISYTSSPEIIIFLNALIIVAGWYTVAYFTWYQLASLRVWQSRTLWIATSEIISLTVWFLFFHITGLLNKKELWTQLPFQLVAGSLCFLILFPWYEKEWQHSKETADHIEEEEEEATPPREDPGILQRISVKDGTRIHLFPVEELYYIEACGDYVTLFTSSGQYVKEQTMKYFETHLPDREFIRIHRSYIIAASQIVRIELFAKENYQVRLKNGTTLRASNAGYKLLKQKLGL